MTVFSFICICNNVGIYLFNSQIFLERVAHLVTIFLPSKEKLVKIAKVERKTNEFVFASDMRAVLSINSKKIITPQGWFMLSLVDFLCFDLRQNKYK